MFSIINLIKKRKKKRKEKLKNGIKEDLSFIFQEKKKKYVMVFENFSFFPVLLGILGVFIYEYIKYFTCFYFFIMSLLIFSLEKKKEKKKNLFFIIFLEILAVYCFSKIVFLIFRAIWELVK